jgi:hypothetical protein
MNNELTEVSRELDLLIVGDAGMLEANDPVLEPVSADLLDILLVVAIEVETDDVGADIAVMLDCGDFFSCQHSRISCG